MSEAADSAVEWAESVEGDRIPLPVRTPSPFVSEWATALIHAITKDSIFIEYADWDGCDRRDDCWHWRGDKAEIDRLLQAIVDKAISDAVLKIERFIVKEVV